MKEILLTNKFGGNANYTLDGEMSRMYSSYLTASFHAPQDRVVIMDGIDEKTAAGAICAKRVNLEYEENIVRIEYAVENREDRDICLELAPWITFRKPEQPAASGEIGFTTVGGEDEHRGELGRTEDSQAEHSFGEHSLGEHSRAEHLSIVLEPVNAVYDYEPHRIYLNVRVGSCELLESGTPGQNISDTAMQGQDICESVMQGQDCRDMDLHGQPYISCKRSDKEITGIRYLIDEKTGYTGTGTSYQPYTFCCNIPAESRTSVVITCGACTGDDEPRFKTVFKKISEEDFTTGLIRRRSRENELIMRGRQWWEESRTGLNAQSGRYPESCRNVKDSVQEEQGRNVKDSVRQEQRRSEKGSVQEKQDLNVTGSVQGDPSRNKKGSVQEEAGQHELCIENEQPSRADCNYLEKLRERLILSADNFIVRRESTGFATILAGYPWFLDWGRDTMISFYGLTISTGRTDEAQEILHSFAKYIKNGMLPNVFPGSANEEPQYNTVDASLWYFTAVWQYCRATGTTQADSELLEALRSIIALYSRSREEMLSAGAAGHCYGIYMDEAGLVHAGDDESDQLTWMDVRIDGKAVTPRHGCPIEIEALWYNALMIMSKLDAGDAERYIVIADKVKKSAQIFINTEKQSLYDYAYFDDVSAFNTDSSKNDKNTDESLKNRYKFNDMVRPNQLWAVSLPFTMFEHEVEKMIVDTATKKLLTPLGLRSLASDEPGYIGVYVGDLRSRDMAYHMGTAWGFLFAPYVKACLKVYGKEDLTRIIGLTRAYAKHMNSGCIGGIAEVFDGDQGVPDATQQVDLLDTQEAASVYQIAEGKGCYSQAWSVAALLEAIDAIAYIR